MKKKLLAILLTVCMVLSMAPAALAADSVFTDVKAGDWFADEVKYVYDNGLMNGVGDNAFDPSGSVTRAMVWTTLARLDGVNTAGSDPWWQAGQKWAMENGISDGTMAENNITREQLVTMIWRYAKYIEMDVSEGEDTNILSYTDAFDVNEWAISAMQWACGVGIINGIDGALQPQGDASRAMLAAILYRFVEEVMPEEEEPKPSTPVVPSYPSYPVIPPHSHTYGDWAPNGDGTHTRSYNCGHVGSQSAACSYTTYTLVDGEVHTKTCSVCSHVVTEYHEYDNYKCVCGKDITPDVGVTENPVAIIGATGYNSIKEALTAAVDNDTIYIVAGNHEAFHLMYTHELTAKDITLVGADKDTTVLSGVTFYDSGAVGTSVVVDGLTIKNVTFSGNLHLSTYSMSNITVEDCAFIEDAAIFQDDGPELLTNLIVKDCTFSGDMSGTTSAVMIENVNDLTVMGCTFTDIDHNVLQLDVAAGAVLIEDNNVNGTGDRVFRFTDIPATGVTITIKDNTIVSEGDEDGQLAKATSIADGATVTLSGNTWNGYTDEQLISHNGVWMLPVVMADNAADFVAAMKKVPAGTDKITLVDAEGNTGMVIAPDGEDSTITVSSKEGLLYLDTLFGNWEACFTNGSGNDYSNYAPADGGKGVDYYYGGRWTVSLAADIDLNNATIDPVTITFPTSTSAITFDGNNHTIKNAKIVTDATAENEAGLFNLVYYTAMNNLELDNIHVTGSNVGNSTAGVLAGSCNAGVNNITITNSSVTGGKYTGGVVGYGYTDITNCTLTNVTVKGGYKLGGIIGYICASGEDTGDVTGNTLLTGCTVDGIGDGIYAGGKSEYVAGYVVGNYNCNGKCTGNTVTGMTSEHATANIGKIEAGKTVTQ